MNYKVFLSIVFLLVSGIITAQEKPEPAEKVMDDAYKLAAKENKSVMIVFHASWCSWCKKFEASVTDPTCKDFFEKHFVIRYLDIMERPEKQNIENPGAIDIFKKNGGDGGGIPFFLIYDKDKTLLADSKVRATGDGPEKPLQNIGCPTSDDELAAFVSILEKATKITEAEKTAIKTRFRKNGK
jgi:thiol-disulfide isomerase/thioredoxin